MQGNLIIDGYNLIFSRKRGLTQNIDLKKERESLLEELKRAFPRQRFIVVFDGTREHGENFDKFEEYNENIKVVFTKNKKADDWIKGFLNRLSRKHLYTVITDDKALTHYIRGTGAYTMKIKDFEEKLAKVTKNRVYTKRLNKKEEIQRITDELREIWLKEENHGGNSAKRV